MSEHTEQTAAQSVAAPARVTLEDFIEAVTRGVVRAMAAEQDEVQGYAQLSGSFTPDFNSANGRPLTIVGIVVPSPPTPNVPIGPIEKPIRR